MYLKRLILALIAVGAVSPALAEGFKIEQLRIEGEQHTSEATVRSLLPVKIGDRYDGQTGENIIRSLHASGFYENVTLEQNGNMLIITVKERPIISNISIKGAKVLPNDAILKQMSAMRGSSGSPETELLAERETSQAEKLQAFDNDAGSNTEQALATSGLAKGDFFSQEALVRSLRALDGAYREQGKNNVQITPDVQELARNRVAITIDVDEGKTTRVREIEFVGNRHFGRSRLERQIALTDGTLFSWLTKSDVFSWEKFAQDKARLEAFYRNKGFFDAEIDLENGVGRELNEDKTREKVTVRINEGQRYHWGSIGISGDTKDVPAAKLEKHLSKIKRGKLSNYDTLQNAMAAIRLEMQSAGYAYAEVESSAKRNNEAGTIDITVQVIPGPRIAVREINITGNKKTRDEVIRREFRQMEGAPYDRAKINRSQQRLQQLGYFDEVQIEGRPSAENDHHLDLAVAVKERNTGSLNASAGWSQDDGLVIAGSAAQDNLFGTGKSANIGLSNSKVRKNASLSFTDPYFTADGVSMTYSLFGSDYNPYKLNNSPRSYRIKKYGATAIMGVPVTEYDRVNFGLGAEHLNVKLFPQSPTRYRRFVEQNGHSNRIYKGLLSWYRNTTDDAYWPTKGYQAGVNGEVGLPGSGLQYYQLDHNQTWYVPLNKTFTLMLNGQLGYSGNYGKTKELPFMYAQTGGGLGSVRGYESGSLGPKFNDVECDQNNPPRCVNLGTEYYGGKFAANVNAELLFPFPGIKDNKTVRLSLFADAGSVWDGKTYTPGLYDAQTNPNAHNGYYGTLKHKSTFQNELRYSAGAALTWISPVGPIKLSYAYPLKRKNTDQLQRFQFQLGTTF